LRSSTIYSKGADCDGVSIMICLLFIHEIISSYQQNKTKMYRECQCFAPAKVREDTIGPQITALNILYCA
jgi:hypothetical protein